MFHVLCLSVSIVVFKRPLPSSKNPHFRNDAKCTTFLVKMSFVCMGINNHFHFKGWALNLVLIQRPGGTRKWPIDLCTFTVFYMFFKQRGHCNWLTAFVASLLYPYLLFFAFAHCYYPFFLYHIKGKTKLIKYYKLMIDDTYFSPPYSVPLKNKDILQ